MLLDELIKCIDLLRHRIESHHPTLQQSEARTRTVLIDPLLTTLGWDVANPDLVTVEYDISGGGGRADYALIGQEDKPSAIVEAKKLNTDLSNHYDQIIHYAVRRGIKYAIVTDGDSWELYDVFKQVNWDEKRIMSIRISAMLISEVALKLLMLWRSNLSVNNVSEINSPLLSADPTTEGESVNDKGKANWIRLSDFDPPSGSEPPKAIKYWDGNEVSIKYWKDVIIQTVKKCSETGQLKIRMLPIGTKKTPYVNTSSKNSEGRAMRSFHRIPETSLYVDTWLSAKDSLYRSKKVLSACGCDPAKVFVST